MGNVSSVTDLTRLAQDVQYTTALRGMSESEKEQYFASQKDQLIDSVLDNRQGTFQKTYTDALRNNSIQNSYFFYQQRNRDLNDLGKDMENKNMSAIDTSKFNHDLAQRQYEINEWSYNNKMDTLFVFQLLFVTLALTAGLAYLNRIGVLSIYILGIIVGVLLLIDIAVIINRYAYTSKVRDQRFWNRRQFTKKDIDQGSGAPTECEEAFLDKDSKPDKAPEQGYGAPFPLS
jgi:hypothetical protein